MSSFSTLCLNYVQFICCTERVNPNECYLCRRRIRYLLIVLIALCYCITCYATSIYYAITRTPEDNDYVHGVHGPLIGSIIFICLYVITLSAYCIYRGWQCDNICSSDSSYQNPNYTKWPIINMNSATFVCLMVTHIILSNMFVVFYQGSDYNIIFIIPPLLAIPVVLCLLQINCCISVRNNIVKRIYQFEDKRTAVNPSNSNSNSSVSDIILDEEEINDIMKVDPLHPLVSDIIFNEEGIAATEKI